MIFSGIVEAGEVVIGKKNKATVMGFKEHGSGRIVAKVTHADKTTASKLVKEHIHPGSILHATGSAIYKKNQGKTIEGGCECGPYKRHRGLLGVPEGRYKLSVTAFPRLICDAM